MKNISVIIFLLVFLLVTKFINSTEIEIRKDLLLLKKNDQDSFLRNCEKSKAILESSECLNFLGIKLFLIAYRNQNIYDSELQSIYNKAINYLEIAAKLGPGGNFNVPNTVFLGIRKYPFATIVISFPL